MWPGLVGKGDGAEPPIGLDTMLDLTTAARGEHGTRFDGVDLFLAEPHTPIDAGADEIAALADAVGSRGLVIGSCVAPVWPPVGGGEAMGDADARRRFLDAVKRACTIARRLRELGVRPYGVVRIDSATSTDAWVAAPEENTARIVKTFQEACEIAEGEGERLAAEGEICWGGMHSWPAMVETLERVGRPDRLGFQADMAHTLLYATGANAPEARLLPEEYDWSDKAALDRALTLVAAVLRPWTIDLHVAQSDGTVFGSGSHDKTGRHAMVGDPASRLDPVRHAGLWLRDAYGKPTKAVRHITWDGCMFANDVLLRQETWNAIITVMADVRAAHGWSEPHG
ncbi:MAG: TIM barrel protein [Pseudomonadota bacterium]